MSAVLMPWNLRPLSRQAIPGCLYPSCCSRTVRRVIWTHQPAAPRSVSIGCGSINDQLKRPDTPVLFKALKAATRRDSTDVRPAKAELSDTVQSKSTPVIERSLQTRSILIGISRRLKGSKTKPRLSNVVAPSNGSSPSSPKMTGAAPPSPRYSKYASPTRRVMRVASASANSTFRCGQIPSLLKVGAGTRL